MKTLITIIISFLILSASAQNSDSISTVIKNRLKNDLLEKLFKQGIFDYIDRKLPPFKLIDIEGNEVDSKNLRGKPTLFNFWFTTCAPCIEEIPMLNRIKQTYSAEMNFVAITFDSSDEIAYFIKYNPFDFIQLMEARDYLKSLDLKTYPRTLITDENLIIKYIDNPKPKNERYSDFEMELRSQIEGVIQR